jgi:hypothetical protein
MSSQPTPGPLTSSSSTNSTRRTPLGTETSYNFISEHLNNTLGTKAEQLFWQSIKSWEACVLTFMSPTDETGMNLYLSNKRCYLYLYLPKEAFRTYQKASQATDV